MKMPSMSVFFDITKSKFQSSGEKMLMLAELNGVYVACDVYFLDLF